MTKFSKILMVAILFYLIVVWVTFVYVGENRLVNLNSICLITLISLSLIFFLLITYKKNAPLLLLFVFICFLYFLLRFWSLVIEPATVFDDTIYLTMGTKELNNTLLFLFFSIFFNGFGFFIGSMIIFKKKTPVKMFNIPVQYTSPVLAGILLMFFIVMQVYTYFSLGLGRFGLILEGQKYVRWALFLISSDYMLIIFIVIALEHFKIYKKFNITLMFTILISYALMRVFTGSKASIYYPVIFFLLYKLTTECDFKINVKKLIFYGIPLLIIASLTFYFGFVTRIMLLYGHREESLSLSTVKELSQYKESAVYKTFFPEFTTIDIALSMFKRVNGIDPLLVIVNKLGEAPSKYVNFVDMAKATIDLCFPGRLWEDSLPTSRLFAAIYLGNTMEQIKKVYYTPLFTMYGTAFFHFEWAGGLIFIFFYSLFLAVVYQYFSQSNSKYKVFLQLWWILLVYEALLSMGIEEWIYITYETFIKGALYLGILYLFLKKRKKSIYVNT